MAPRPPLNSHLRLKGGGYPSTSTVGLDIQPYSIPLVQGYTEWFRVRANPLWVLGLGLVEGLVALSLAHLVLWSTGVPHIDHRDTLPEALGAFTRPDIAHTHSIRSTRLTGGNQGIL